MSCYKCDISVHRTNIVFGHGNIDADIMFIGEAPGYNEDKEGVPFVGKSGLIFNMLLEDINIKREDVYVTNIIRCRPPKNREPNYKEIKNCLPFMVHELKRVNPKIIVTLGNTALSFFKSNKQSFIIAERGKVFVLGNKVILPTYHPAFILRNKERLHEIIHDFDMLSKLYTFVNPFYNR